ncbi:MAG: hypothetical protein KDD38_05845 [Bdellovibrionales bacterium]|nr:hypothetical protein [Bdellovibrionales bacterium]
MNKLIMLTLVFGLHSAHAASLKVLKIKGQKAIVQVPASMDVQVGDTLSVSEDGGGESTFGRVEGRGSRVDGAFTYASQTIDSKTAGFSTSTDKTLMTITAEYGWNTGTFEFGPLVTYGSQSVSGVDTSTWSLGGFFEYNFIENKPGELYVPYAGVSVGYGSSDLGGGITYSGLDYGVYGGVKWFPLNDTLAFVPFLRYQSVTRDFDGDNGSTSKDMMLGFGVAKYF